MTNSKHIKNMSKVGSTSPSTRTLIKNEDCGHIMIRKKELFEKLCDNKLEYIKNGSCESFIKYGTPSIDTVIRNIQHKTNIETKRLIRVLKRLKQNGEVYDETNKYYAKYIKDGRDFEYNVIEGMKEWFYKNRTDYMILLKLYKDDDIAKAMAFNKYVRNHPADKYTNLIIQSEMIIRLY